MPHRPKGAKRRLSQSATSICSPISSRWSRSAPLRGLTEGDGRWMATNLVRSSNPLPTCGAWLLQRVIGSFFGQLSHDTLGNNLAAGLSGRGAGRAHVDQLRVGPLGHLFPSRTRRCATGWTRCSCPRRNTDGTRRARDAIRTPEPGGSPLSAAFWLLTARLRSQHGPRLARGGHRRRVRSTEPAGDGRQLGRWVSPSSVTTSLVGKARTSRARLLAGSASYPWFGSKDGSRRGRPEPCDENHSPRERPGAGRRRTNTAECWCTGRAASPAQQHPLGSGGCCLDVGAWWVIVHRCRCDLP